MFDRDRGNYLVAVGELTGPARRVFREHKRRVPILDARPKEFAKNFGQCP